MNTTIDKSWNFLLTLYFEIYKQIPDVKRGVMFKNLFHRDTSRREALSTGCVVPDASRCVQCGVCSYNCPIGIDIRSYAWQGKPIQISECLTCGECILRCPRGVLRFERTNLFAEA
jgi:Fe-S oxidoreductase